MCSLSPILSEDEFFDCGDALRNPPTNFHANANLWTTSGVEAVASNAHAVVLHEKELPAAVINTSTSTPDDNAHTRLAHDQQPQQSIATFITTADEYTRLLAAKHDSSELLGTRTNESPARICKESRAEVIQAVSDTTTGEEARCSVADRDVFDSDCGAERPEIDCAATPERSTASRRHIEEADTLTASPSATTVTYIHDSPITPLRKMNTSHGEDLFMEEADTQGSARLARLPGRLSRDKRQSISHVETRAATSFEPRRPRTSGGLDDGRPVSRSGLRQAQYGIPRSRELSDDTSSLAGIGIRPRLGSRFERHPLSPRSPNERSPESYVPLRSRTFNMTADRPPLKLQDSEGSPAESAGRKQSVPSSADSQTAASTMWDDIDELKSRIKKLELASHPDAVPQERPRTATTAPTTIDSSPKREKKSDEATSEDTQPTISAPAPATVHPLLHTALAKAKGLLNPALYRSLDATATDALQMVMMTGSTHDDTTALDRQLRRKADSMCRNLTDLCLALCEGKHEASISPVSAQLSNSSPTRFARTPLHIDSDPRPARPLSRLEARRSSILGNGPAYSPLSARRDADEMSEFETQSLYIPRRHLRSSSRMSTARASTFDDAGDDPTIRPAPSEFSFRSKQMPNTRLFNSVPQRSFSLRDALNERRGSGVGIADHRDLARVASMSSDTSRRWQRETTPPVVEEDGERRHLALAPTERRLGSFSSLRQNRVLAPLRSSSISSRRSQQVMIE